MALVILFFLFKKIKWDYSDGKWNHFKEVKMHWIVIILNFKLCYILNLLLIKM